MKSSIYISAEKIEVIGYAGSSVKKFTTYPLAEGTMINGTITDAAFLTECLAAMRKENPQLFTDPSLVVDGSAILSRRLVTPKLNNKRYLQLVRDDFADTTDDPDSLVCGYHKLSSEGSSEAILACAANKGLVDSYISAFKDAGIRLSAIRVGAEALNKVVSSRQELKKASFVLTLIDGFTTVSMVFNNGNNVFMSRSRLYGDTKEQIYQNVLENLNGLINFNRSQKFNEITQCYYLGVNEAEMRLIDALNPYAGIKMDMLDIFGSVSGKLPPEAHLVYLNMLMPSDSINLLTARRELDKHIKHKKPRKLWIPLMALYILLLALPSGYMWWQAYTVNQDIEEINAYLQDPEVLRKRAELDDVKAERGRYLNITGQYNEMTAWEESMTMVSSRLLDLFIRDYGDSVSVTQLDYDEKALQVRLSAKCAEEDIATYYTDFLKLSDMIEFVNFRGVTYDSNGLYSFSLDITLAMKDLAEGEAE
ncbi:MAG: hypothetical protein LBI19_07430 [Oscillospiraceae bacterium]|jgi:hypothetical protein|nr:hypothetical protein [Oscillospiraceae bacterium]